MANLLLPFTKMQGLGNDFVVVDGRAFSGELGRLLATDSKKKLSLLARVLCDRHYGIGADGLIIVFHENLNAVLAGQHALSGIVTAYPDARSCSAAWIYINGDGSSSDMCGNGLRCLGLYIRNHVKSSPQSVQVATACGPVAVLVQSEESITVDLNKPILASEAIPTNVKGQSELVRHPVQIELDGKRVSLSVTCVSMGNPHCVLFDDAYAACERGDRVLAAMAEKLQQLPLFPEGANIEFASVANQGKVNVLIWERGCGPTLACASGAAATLVAGVLEDRVAREAQVCLPGGDLIISWSEKDGHVRMTGPAKQIYSAEIDLLQFSNLRASLAAEALC